MFRLFHSFMQFVPEGLQTSFEDPVHLCDRNAVVDDGDAGAFRRLHTVPHGRLVEHTAAAVDHEGVITQLFGKFAAGAEGKTKLLSRIAADPAR